MKKDAQSKLHTSYHLYLLVWEKTDVYFSRTVHNFFIGLCSGVCTEQDFYYPLAINCNLTTIVTGFPLSETQGWTKPLKTRTHQSFLILFSHFKNKCKTLLAHLITVWELVYVSKSVLELSMQRLMEGKLFLILVCYFPGDACHFRSSKRI